MGQGIVTVLNISKKLTFVAFVVFALFEEYATPAAFLSYLSAPWSSLGIDESSSILH